MAQCRQMPVSWKSHFENLLFYILSFFSNLFFVVHTLEKLLIFSPNKSWMIKLRNFSHKHKVDLFDVVGTVYSTKNWDRDQQKKKLFKLLFLMFSFHLFAKKRQQHHASHTRWISKTKTRNFSNRRISISRIL